MSARREHLRLGAVPMGGERCSFRVWAPRPQRIELCLLDAAGQVARSVPLERDARGMAHVVLDGVPTGTPYQYRLGGSRDLPDPASRLQAAGVHGPSLVVDPAHPWHDDGWHGLPLERYVLYELHVGTFSRLGNFDGVVQALDRLVALGITAIELMPSAPFPGDRNWGYDGVLPYAVHRAYGGPAGLRRLVDACHAHGLAVVLDVVYNHLGPEGNYLHAFGPYFTDAYRTPWGQALNFDAPGSDGVRRYFVENALEWVEQYHVDALRLDAVHAIYDRSAYPILEEIADALHAAAKRLGRPIQVIAESDLNDPRLVTPTALGGSGLDAVWSDDFHHALHALLTGESQGYYQDYGGVESLARAWQAGFVYEGQYSPHRQRRHGRPARNLAPERLVVCAQNHDQVGNRMCGERLARLVDFESLKLAAGVVMLSPFTPLLFMGEEYAAQTPFVYFTSHSDPDLVEAVRQGRRREFAAFGWQGELPDPQSEASFERCRLDPDQGASLQGQRLSALYRALITQRQWLPRTPRSVMVDATSQLLWTVQGQDDDRWLVIFAFADRAPPIELPVPSGTWRKRLDSADPAWGGSGTGWPTEIGDVARLRWQGGRGFALYQRVPDCVEVASASATREAE